MIITHFMTKIPVIFTMMLNMILSNLIQITEKITKIVMKQTITDILVLTTGFIQSLTFIILQKITMMISEVTELKSFIKLTTFITDMSGSKNFTL